MENIALWMSQPHFSYLEIARTCGFSSFVLELEHGTFDLSTLDQFLAFTKAQGLSTLTKVLAPTPEAIQQALDFGSNGVIVPHILGVEHAHQVTKAAKYPLVGTRSYTGGRVFGYARPETDAFEKENKRTKCFAMVETAESLADVEKIIALDTVDGLFPGPSDLALARGRGAYAFNDDDKADLRRCAAAAHAAGKPWIMPAWTKAERRFAQEEGAAMLVVATQNMTLRQGMVSTVNMLKSEALVA
ncbi:hpcH/HpaI aldolase/citrate lyase family protein (plasmid) [Ochrobactrum quorumnocens]|uniref:HpcH/HpaI aldolase/citrate lyase family protein n=1 Tax=Ochrobactrum quorumnocens TaxID=271865 RepID=A0A248UN35_9HYPH|nr:aldolase/citrate lyase family protein [[Ochrobactrum] quorumnocens]ASV88098.1 hpcH/HpaI aldolase/citrate lyase family protein [[Ochrobactrum] quorumnocens]